MIHTPFSTDDVRLPDMGKGVPLEEMYTTLIVYLPKINAILM